MYVQSIYTSHIEHKMSLRDVEWEKLNTSHLATSKIESCYMKIIHHSKANKCVHLGDSHMSEV